MLFEHPEDWAMLARAIGFTPYEPAAAYGASASFRQLKRALGQPATPTPHYRHWLRGMRGDRRALVLNHVVGAGSSQQEWTEAIIEIDPPLFLGTSVGLDGTLTRFFSGQDVLLGVPQLDDVLRLGALDTERLRALLLSREGSSDFLDALAHAVQNGFTVTDSTVTWSGRGRITNPDTISNALDRGAWIASEIGRRRAALPLSPVERHARAEWQAFADQRGLTFDPPRFHMHGTVSGADVEMALETNGGFIKTGIGVRFPHVLPIGLRVQRAGAMTFLRRLFKSSIKTGDPAFDSHFIVEGQPAEYVRQVFANPGLRATLLRIVVASIEFTMTESQIFWIFGRPTILAEGLEHHLTAAVTATEALFGVAKDRGPYR